MFGSCYKYTKNKSEVTIYSDKIRAILFVLSLFMVPTATLFIPGLSFETQSTIFVLSSVLIFLILIPVYKYSETIPLLAINKEGIRPILDKKNLINLNSKIIKWENIKEIFVYKPPLSYITDVTENSQNGKQAGFRYLGINLKNHNETDINSAQTIISPKVRTMIPYLSNNIDIPLTSAHPFQKGLIKVLTHYYEKNINL